MKDDGYRTSAGFMAAVKDAARRTIADRQAAAGLSLGELLEMAIRDRLLTRVFHATSDDSWLLKGGNALLARIPSGRSTLDVDLATIQPHIEDAIEEFRAAVATDLNDGLQFQVESAQPLAVPTQGDDVQGLKVMVACRGVEGKRYSSLSVDLVTEPKPVGTPERRTPESRIHLGREGLITSDYLLYPIEDQVADKISGIVTVYASGRLSTREKDLVDLVLYVSHEQIQLDPLRGAIARRRAQQVPIGTDLSVPAAWGSRYAAQATQVGIPEDLRTPDRALDYLRPFLSPTLSESAERSGLVWRHGAWQGQDPVAPSAWEYAQQWRAATALTSISTHRVPDQYRHPQQ